MTYNYIGKSATTWIVYPKNTDQTVTQGDAITFADANKRSTGPDSVSINSTTGIITLASNKKYWIQAHLYVDMGADDDFCQIEFQDSNGNTLGPGDGNFPYYHDEVTSKGGRPRESNSYMASLVVENPSLTYKLVPTTIRANSAIMGETHLFIIEVR
tara:strand:+ start:62 stop:532 length:471 start_codon:yes stop_codon:yes gene_type:complete